MKKIAFVCVAGLDNFIDDIIGGLSDDYIVRKFIIRTKQEVYNAIDWADIIWLEWANEAATIGTNYEGIKGKKVIIRLHGYEVFSDVPRKIKWDVVDRLIFVAKHVRKILKTDIPDIEDRVKIEMVYNGVDVERFQFRKREAGYDIAWIGYICYKKDPMMALQIIKKLTKGIYTADKRYKLHIAGSHQDLKIKLYLEYMIKEMGLEDNIIFYNWVDDINIWLQDKNYLLSTAIFEGYGCAIVEAMTQGVKPIIHNFYAARDFYPERYLFNTIDEAVDEITSKKYDSREYRDWIINNSLTLEKQVKQIKGIIKEI